VLFAGSGAVFAAGLLGAAMQLPTFGTRETTYARTVLAGTIALRHITNAPTAVTFDYRGLDTLGEEFILFGALLGMAQVLTRGKRQVEATHEDTEEKRGVPADRGELIRIFALASLAGVLMIGIDTVTHGQLSPGSGFQGGVIASAGWLMLYLGFGADAYDKLTRQNMVEAMESLGAAAYVVLGCVGVISGAAFLQNVLPLGRTGRLLSGGTTTVINLAVGLEVAMGFVLAYGYMLDVARTRTPSGG
jgi:multicomponent Na+:H+ antiporter subunit B